MNSDVEGGTTNDGRAVPSEPVARRDAARRTALLSSALIALATAGLFLVDLDPARSNSWSLPLAGVAALAFASSFLVFNVEFRRESYTFTFGEIVLVIGLFFASPLGLVVGRLIGEAVFLLAREHQPPRKLLMNLSAGFAETVALLIVTQTLQPVLDPRDPVSWLVAAIGVVIAQAMAMSMIALALRWHGGPITMGTILRIGLFTAPANTSLALVVCVLLDDEPAAVPLLAGVAVFLLVMYRAYSALKQRYDSLSLLYDFTHLVSGAREPDEVLDAMLVQAKDLFRAERAEFWLSIESSTYRRHVVDDVSNSRADVVLPGALAEIASALASSRDSVRIERGTTVPVEVAALEVLGGRDALIAPVLEGEDVIGFVAVIDRIGEMVTFDPQDARLFATLASHAGVALQNGRLIVRLHDQARQREYEALHDPLTGLPNRALFGDSLARQLAGEHDDLAIALMDLDGFKEINDTLGHQAGDHVLVEIAHRLGVTVPDHVVAARLGGDEFALLTRAGTGRDEMERLCKRVRDAIAAPMQVEHLSVNMGVSIGVAIAPSDGSDAETLLRRADVAMYAAKAGHQNGVCFYDPRRDENTPRRLALAHDLRTAIAAGQIETVFQPKVSIVDGRLTGVECLCRWNHPVLGDIAPDEFIPLAEKTGAIGDLTTFMLASACGHAARWSAAGHDWNVAVNISVRNLLDTSLVGRIGELLTDVGLDPSTITLEITESHVMSDAVRTAHVLEDLAAMGVRLSIDDFGTGYSSLAYLQRLPVDEMKIDKTFVAELAIDRGAEAVVRSVLDLARNLDLHVVAEGVEDAETLGRLQMLGCTEAQGYLFAAPMSADEVERFAAERDPRSEVALAAQR
jgi:diguanylate cyclase (GGDEF)-like protein